MSENYIYDVGVIGTFYDPLHIGHLNSIYDGANECKELYVVLFYSETNDSINYKVRYQWIYNLTNHFDNIKIILCNSNNENIERYKMVAKEIKDYLHGKYGKAPAAINEEIKNKIIGNDEVITCRPADLLEPEFEKLKEKYKDIARSDEDVLSLALFEQVATEFLNKKYNPQKDDVDEFNMYI